MQCICISNRLVNPSFIYLIFNFLVLDTFMTHLQYVDDTLKYLHMSKVVLETSDQVNGTSKYQINI